MNICFFNSELHWGGGEKWHFKMAQLFNNDGYNVFIAVNKGSELEERAKENSIKTKPFVTKKFSFLNPFKIYKLYKFFKTEKIDTVFMNNPLDLKMCTIAGSLARVKNIIYRRGMPHPIRNTALNRWMFGSVLTHLIVISLEVERSIFANNPNIIAKDKLLLLYNAIDDNDYKPIVKKPADKIIFGNTGRLVEQKGQHHLIEAAVILKEKGYDFEIRIAGKGPLEAELTNLIAVNQLQGYVSLVGFIKKLDPFMNDIDVFVFPSYFEGSASSIIEAMYFSKPCIVFNVSTMPELVEDNVSGYVVKFKDSVEFAAKMEMFIKDKGLITMMGTKGKELSHQYNLHNVFKKIKEVL